MKRLVRYLALSVLLIACIAIPVYAQNKQVTITLLHVNDTHSHLDATGPKDWHLDGTTGGMAKAATIISDIRRREPNLLLLHAGDVFHGDFFFNAYFGVPEFEFMQQLGFDAMAVGNHEFDLGPGGLAYALSQAFKSGGFPLLSANLDLAPYDKSLGPGSPRLSDYIHPSIIKAVGGVNIGIFGMTVPGLPTTMSAPVAILGTDPNELMGIAYYQMAALRSHGAQVVICLSHLGYLYDQAMAEHVPGIDIIVGGHDHYEFAQPLTFSNQFGGKTLYVQAGQHYEHVGKMHFIFYQGKVSLKDYTLIDVDKKIPPLPQIQAVLDGQLKPGIVKEYGDVYHTPLALALGDVAMTYDPDRRERDSGMGDLITDAMRNKTHTDIAITVNGLISEGIPGGLVVGADIFRPVSYGYDVPTGLGLKLATFQIKALDLIKGLEIGLAFLGIDEDYFVQVSGMRFQYDGSKPPYQRIVLSSVFINGKPLDPAKSYTVTANTGLVSLLPLMEVTVLNTNELPDLEYTVLRNYIQRLLVLFYPSMGRIEDISVHGK